MKTCVLYTFRYRSRVVHVYHKYNFSLIRRLTVGGITTLIYFCTSTEIKVRISIFDRSEILGPNNNYYRYPQKSFLNCLINNALGPLRFFRIGPYKQVRSSYETL